MQRILQIIFFILFVKPFMILFIGMRVYGQAHVPRDTPFIVIANHSSHLDALALLHLFPLAMLRKIRSVAAQDYFEINKIISVFSKTCFNILPIPRTGITRTNNPLEKMRDVLRKKEALIIFPEGKRSWDGSMSDFKSGVGHIVKDFPDVPVIPIFITNVWRSLPKGEWLPVPFICDVLVGKPLFLTGPSKSITEELEKVIHDLKKEAGF